MGAVDVFVRAIALAILLFVVALLALTFLSFWVEDVSPLRQAVIFATLSVGSAGGPLLLIYLARAAAGARGGDDTRARLFSIFTVLVVVLAVLFGGLIASGQISV
jgi:hypothetical protein